MNKEAKVQIDVACDVQQIDETGFVWTFLDEAEDEQLIAENSIVIAADGADPVVARVVSLTPGDRSTIVHLEILPGDPSDYAEARLRRTS